MDPICHVQAEHISILRFFGWFMLAGGIISCMKNVTYFRGVIYKEENPFDYWVGTIGLMLLGTMTLLGLHFCQ